MLYCLLLNGVIQYDKAGQSLIFKDESSAVNCLKIYPNLVIARVGLTYPQ